VKDSNFTDRTIEEIRRELTQKLGYVEVHACMHACSEQYSKGEIMKI
jgi:translation initiation factor 2 gamma subunit (eIF-2gamma)